jgi:hypothetical protein
VRRAGPLLVISTGAIAACSLFLDSGEFSSEDDDRDGGGTSDAPIDPGTGGDGAPNDASIAPDVDVDIDAAVDFCTRSFVDAGDFYSFDLPPQTNWDDVYCEANASITGLGNDGKPAPAVRIATDGGVPNGTFRLCWLEKQLAVGRTYRFGFDTKLASSATNGGVNVARFELDFDEGSVTSYTMSLVHGLAPAAVAHRFGETDGGAMFLDDKNVGPASLDWVSYRIEVVVDPAGTSRYTLCRDGVLVQVKNIVRPLAVPKLAVFDIGLTYIYEKQTAPVDVRMDNVFVEVAP